MTHLIGQALQMSSHVGLGAEFVEEARVRHQRTIVRSALDVDPERPVLWGSALGGAPVVLAQVRAGFGSREHVTGLDVLEHHFLLRRHVLGLGDLVKSDNFTRNETELVVIVTPYLVEPYKEVELAERVPKDNSRPLAQAFAVNIRRNYEIEDESLFEAGAGFGYLLD